MSRPVKTPLSPDYRTKIGTAAETLFAERGFDGTSLREIAERTGVTKSLIYHYYENKEALYQAILEDGVSGVVTQVEEIAENGEEPKTQIRAVVQVFLDAYQDAPHRFQMIQRAIDDHHSIAAVIAERWFSRAHLALQVIVAEGVRQGGFKPLPAQMVPFAIIGLIVHTLRGQKLVSHVAPNLSGEQVLAALPDLVLALLTAVPGQRKISGSCSRSSRWPGQVKRRAKV